MELRPGEGVRSGILSSPDISWDNRVSLRLGSLVFPFSLSMSKFKWSSPITRWHICMENILPTHNFHPKPETHPTRHFQHWSQLPEYWVSAWPCQNIFYGRFSLKQPLSHKLHLIPFPVWISSKDCEYCFRSWHVISFIQFLVANKFNLAFHGPTPFNFNLWTE